MVALVVYLTALLVIGWGWFRWCPGRRAARATAPPARSSSACPPARRSGLHPDPGVTPLTEDDVIAFGLALEGTSDVVRCALMPQRAPTEPRLRRDVAGPS